MNRVAFPVAGLFVVAGFALSAPASAATQDRILLRTGADMCTLSVPTTDTKVRPRATGFGNEGTTNAFVICTFDTPPGGFGPGSDFQYARWFSNPWMGHLTR